MPRLPICDVEGHVCFGHACDHCAHCESGVCCGEAVVTADLPPVGSWEGETHVPLGQMRVTQEGRVTCHICGETFIALWMHIKRKHGVDADTYRSLFGLRTTEPLCGPIMADARSDRQGAAEAGRTEQQQQEAVARLAQHRMEFTAEQRSVWSRNREQRLQVTGEGMGRLASAGAAAWHSRRAADPEADRAWRGKLIVAKRRLLDEGTTCSVCGAQFCVVNSRAIRARSPRKTCGAAECRTEIKRRAQRASAASRRAARA